MSQLTYKNVVGPKIRSLRIQFSWTQDTLAKYLRRMGWNISRSTLAKVEARLICVSDSDLLYFVRLFEVEPTVLFPQLDPTAHLGTDVQRLLARQRQRDANQSNDVIAAPAKPRRQRPKQASGIPLVASTVP